MKISPFNQVMGLNCTDGISTIAIAIAKKPYFFYGNAGNISYRLDSLQIFHGMSLSILLIDYRGYGRSEGSLPHLKMALIEMREQLGTTSPMKRVSKQLTL